MSERVPQILNVNDDAAARYVMTKLLRKAGYEVAEAATGCQALHSITDAVALLDENGVVVKCNRAFAATRPRSSARASPPASWSSRGSRGS